MEGKQPIKYRISNWGMTISLFLGGVAELISLVPGAGDIVAPIFFFFFSIYLWKSGVGVFNGKKLATSIISLVAEMIPVVQELPALIVGVSAVIIMTRIEDRTGISLSPTKKVGVTSPRNQRIPVNSTPGVRPPRIQGSV